MAPLTKVADPGKSVCVALAGEKVALFNVGGVELRLRLFCAMLASGLDVRTAFRLRAIMADTFQVQSSASTAIATSRRRSARTSAVEA